MISIYIQAKLILNKKQSLFNNSCIDKSSKIFNKLTGWIQDILKLARVLTQHSIDLKKGRKGLDRCLRYSRNNGYCSNSFREVRVAFHM